MKTERKQILLLLATRRITAAEAERLLVLSSGEDRFFAWATAAILAIAVLGRPIRPVLPVRPVWDAFGAAFHGAIHFADSFAVVHQLSMLLNHLIGVIQ
jgi:hypothetical protein